MNSCYERQQQILELEHYLDVLERKPGALAGSKPFARWRAKGLSPASYDRLLDELIQRHGNPSGTRQMIQVLPCRLVGFMQALDQGLDADRDPVAIRGVWSEPFSVNRKAVDTLAAVDKAAVDTHKPSIKHRSRKNRATSRAAANNFWSSAGGPGRLFAGLFRIRRLLPSLRDDLDCFGVRRRTRKAWKKSRYLAAREPVRETHRLR
jgi:hypothetical protein